MFRHKHTNEFSVVLLLGERLSEDINYIRSLLPPSPYRDDRPHVTLLKRIHSPRSMGDQELLIQLKPILDSLLKVKPHAHVDKVTNFRGGLYKRTSALAINTTPELQREHNGLISELKNEKYRIDKKELSFYQPHATIRLGVPLPSVVRIEAEKLFPKGREVIFRSWEIFRLESGERKRLFYEVKA